eukprot:CAMPEP_0169450346 /NCGR_PEP_ID=MMETSP1042-20121227/13106_1 /TAXON_ID=464988 /ORGANISM="Hemiselmis andersenii, Strain CCMP1180" /LENGTH=221 /DNA_ID=CAMNT_0009562167 /DNA_START=165 /DNA_END=827 /DNA_ORIENTATION=-
MYRVSRGAAAALLLLSLPSSLSFAPLAPSPLHRRGGFAAHRSPSILASPLLLRAQLQPEQDSDSADNNADLQRNSKAATLEPPQSSAPGSSVGNKAGPPSSGGPRSLGQESDKESGQFYEVGESGIGLGGGADGGIVPRLYPDPASSSILLAVIGLSAYAAAGGMPEASGALASFLGEVCGGTPFSQSLLGLFAVGSLSAIVAEAIAFPFDSIKTRMQLSS